MPAQPPMITSQYHNLIHTTAPWGSPSSTKGLFFRRKASCHRLVSTGAASDLMCPPSVRNPPNVSPDDELWKQEIVPYTNRVHWVIPLLKEPNNPQLLIDIIKKRHIDNILEPSHPDTVRVRLIVNDIIRGIHQVLLAKSPCDNDSSLKAAEPQTEHLRELDWEVFIIETKLVNAYSLCGGKIVIYTGMLDSFDTDAEIATILAHEIGHVVAKHVLELTEIMECLIPFLGKLLPFSRRKEIEADRIGIMLLAAAGFDPRVAPGVYEKLGEISGDSPWDDYIGTHPLGKTRSRLLSQGKVMEEALELYRKQV